MKNKEKLYSLALISAVIALFFVLTLSTASANSVQSDSSAGPYAYVANEGNNTVSVIDTATNTVVATVPVGSHPYDVAVNPEGTKVYVTNMNSSNVSVIDTATNTVKTIVKVGIYPYGVAVSPDGTKAYVANSLNGTISVIDTATDTVTATVDAGYSPMGIAVSPDGKRIYVTNWITSSVSVIDTVTNDIIYNLKVKGIPWEIAVNPTGTKAYVTNFGGNNISVIDTTTNTIEIVDVGHDPWGVAVNPAGTKVYVANWGSSTSLFSGNISVIDTATNNTSTVNVGLGPAGIAVNQEGTKVYVTNEFSGTVSVIDTATNTVTNTVKVGYGPMGIAITPAPKKSAPPVADFTATPTSGEAPLTVNFTDKSTGSPTSWVWDFGDGNSATGQAVSHTYQSNGTYTVNLMVSNADGSDSKAKIGYITVSEPSSEPSNQKSRPVANFRSNVTEGNIPLSVRFTDLSTNATEWDWDFGDGYTSTEQNPTHSYSQTGDYTVALTASNGAVTDTETKTAYIKVKSQTDTNTNTNTDTADNGNGTCTDCTDVKPASSKPVAAFCACPTSGDAPLKVKFADESTGSPTSWKWSFGDGTSSTEKSPAHTYSKAGKYTVTLTTKNANGCSTKTRCGYITVKNAECSGTAAKSGCPNAEKALKAPVAAFSASPTSGNAPIKVHFTDKSTGSPTSWKWSFGDGTYSTEKNPVHIYKRAGKYTVSLTVKNTKDSSTIKKCGYINVANSSKASDQTSESRKSSTEKNTVHVCSKSGKKTVTSNAKNSKGGCNKTASTYASINKRK